MEMIPGWIPVVFFVIAFFYSTAGFGGGSSYLAVLILAGLPYERVPTVALTCNLIVAGSGFWHFYRGGFFSLRNLLPFVVLSIPMAYAGGSLAIDKKLLTILLGFSLLIAGARIFSPKQSLEETRNVSSFQTWLVGLPVGGCLGFLSGLIGIGGGIFLSPLLLLMRWVDTKGAAASASFFIIVNSLAGLAGQFHKGWGDARIAIPLALSVFLGGQIGSLLAVYRLPRPVLEKALAVLIFYVSIRLLWGSLL